MQRWEYFTTTLTASVADAPVPIRDDIVMPPAGFGKYSVYALIPQLNHFGDQGWELVSIEPVSLGRNGDVVRPDANAARWGRDYFCCFKRQVLQD